VHIKTIGINPQVIISLEMIKELPVNYDILSSLLIILFVVEFLLLISDIVSNWDLIEGDLKLHEVRELGKFNSSSHTGFDV
jgi:hypothetical protein